MANEQIATSTESYRTMLKPNIQLFGDTGEGAGDGAGGSAATGTDPDNKGQGDNGNGLSSEDIQKMIQSTVDQKTADLGKTIAALKKENADLKKANMTAEELQKAEKEEFEKQKAEVELQKRQIFAHKAVATAGYGDNAEAVVDIVLGDTDEKTTERLQNFKSLVDKLVSETVEKTFKANGRVPNGAGNGGADTKETKENELAKELGKKAAETAKQSNDILKHYYGG